MRSTLTMTEPIIISAEEIGVRLGYGGRGAGLDEWLAKLGYELVEGRTFEDAINQATTGDAIPSEPVLGLPVDDAITFLREATRRMSEHYSAWDRYVAYRDRKKREAVEARERAADEARRSSLARAKQMADEAQVRQARQAAEEAAERAARKAEREGSPVSFDEFVAGRA